MKRIFTLLHVLTVVGIIYYLFFQSLSIIHLILFILGWVFISGFGVSVGLHRAFSHRTHNLKKWFKGILLYFSTISCESSSLIWCSLHRGVHHPKADTKDDPQSIYLLKEKGFLWVLYRWKSEAYSYINYKSVPDLVRDPIHVFFHRNYNKIILISWVFGALISLDLLFFFFIFPTFLSVWSNNLENVLSHIPKLGYRNYERKDHSTNVWWMMPFGWGACSLHNNHHQFPNKFNFSSKWWEIDLSVIFLPLLKIGSIK
jgi:stearoyl-CoA desaturase (delta-9 desaturase)